MVEYITIENGLCTGCGICELRCSLAHENVFSPTLSRIHIERNWKDGTFSPHMCRQCDDLPCVEACPTGSLQFVDGHLEVDHETCVLCGECVEACPYDAIWLVEKVDRIIVCDLCGGDPICVKYCPTKALKIKEK